MKLKFIPIPLLLSLSLLISCKTTEENYRSAYEVAKARQTEGLTDREIAAMQREESLPKVVYKGDSIPLKSVYVKWVEGGAGGTALRYNVVVNSFKQQFNARSVLMRLRDAGYATPSSSKTRQAATMWPPPPPPPSTPPSPPSVPWSKPPLSLSVPLIPTSSSVPDK